MVDIFRDEATTILKDNDDIIIYQADSELRIHARELETVVELAPCVTMGKYIDVRVVSIRAAGHPIIYIPVSKEGAKRILTQLQQCKLNAAKQIRRHDTA
ncbi:hypothetical protein [Alicyclobacillus sp. SO9]|uniref:hypothetical protein n=1 Tax=Alicyclobacillus sp. SO9 TaxID=2665646 RepID=UPI0018E83617|nr:hypothetical protein [Alicyclobacillus sp. SO9]QQE77169.1 hypothetical protein GI364_14460 [Alicyclobacillus sp. SO9]